MIASIRDARLLEQAMRQPVLAFTAIEVPGLLEAVRREHFPELPPTPIVFVAPGPRAPLACIVNAETAERRIYVHAVLNDARCPEHVFSLIAKHELAHTAVRPRKIDGRWAQHPPEFWELGGRHRVAHPGQRALPSRLLGRHRVIALARPPTSLSAPRRWMLTTKDIPLEGDSPLEDTPVLSQRHDSRRSIASAPKVRLSLSVRLPARRHGRSSSSLLASSRAALSPG